MSTTIQSDDDLVARFIAERGVTKCPAAFAAPTMQVNLTNEDREAHRTRAVDEPVKPAYGRVQYGKRAQPWNKVPFSLEMDEALRLMFAERRAIQGYMDKALGMSWLPIYRRAKELGLTIPGAGTWARNGNHEK